MDGDDAQQPVIMGVFANTKQASSIMSGEYTTLCAFYWIYK